MTSKFIIASLLGLATAQTTTLTLRFLGYDEQAIAASVVSANADATTFQLNCVQSASACGLFPKHTLVTGPSTYNMDMSDPNTDFTATQDCLIAASSAVCKETAGGSEANFPGSSTETYEASQIGSLPVTVTAGVEKLSGSAGVTATGSVSSASAATTGSGASRTTASVTQVSGTGSASGSPSASRSGSAPPTNSTGAAAANTVALGSGLVVAVAGLLNVLLL
ncbi:hypothetical protein BKA66DRAFT_572893 [Pyrenochaeta sp. MPI-SDFR-AT-0127]|nr:hypothetical protein BKA66DRAFT_572893 [Pyrenochaeta sp. MPI-SDFR-AT-0127]